MKRLLAAGGEAIYQVSRVFRQEEQGSLHNPEFTLVEWYRTSDDFAWWHAIHKRPVREAVGSRAGRMVDLRRCLSTRMSASIRIRPILKSLIAAARIAARLRRKACRRRPRRLARLAVDRESASNLGVERPVLLYDFPDSQAALAQIGRAAAAGRAVRALCVWLGVGQRLPRTARCGRASPAQRRGERAPQADGKAALPEESRLLAAMDHGLPAAVGCALGFDRLVMLAAGANRSTK